MSFVTELDALTAKLQERLDSVVAEARTELSEMAASAEREWVSLWQEIRQDACEKPAPAGEEASSQPETSAQPPEEAPMA